MVQGEMQKVIREKGMAGLYRLTLHAEKERLMDQLTTDHIEQALSTAEVIEDYPEDKRGHSCLVLGWSSSGPVHLVIGGLEGGGQAELVVITIYRPDLSQWEADWRTRKEKTT